MNNLHFTNFQASQDGTRRYRYRFAATPTAPTREQVRVFGHALLEPLQARHWSGPARTGPTGLRVEPAETVFAEVRPVGDGAVRVRLRNIGADAVSAAVHWNGSREVALPAFGVADVILTA